MRIVQLHNAAGVYGQPHLHHCCMWYWHLDQPAYLLNEKITAHATIRSTASQTTLEQTFRNVNDEPVKKCHYNFPLYAGISVNSFTCHIESKTIHGVVTKRASAKAIFDRAVAKGQTAGLLEQNTQTSDIFQVSLGNIPPKATVKVRIEFVGELKYDAEVEGIRYTIPTAIAPRYGYEGTDATFNSGALTSDSRKMEIVVDVDMADGSPVQSIQSPSHPISVSIGVNSKDLEADPVLTRGSATLFQNHNHLEEDIVVMIKAKRTEQPTAILEKHPFLKDHRALMTTLVPRFSLAQTRPEVVFIADRSGSMEDKIPMLITALNVFLKSLPQGVKFNICSFGSSVSTLWDKSQRYSEESLTHALKYVKSFAANFGGTETWTAIDTMIQRRFTDLPLEIILLTDGDIWQQEEAFKALRRNVDDSKGQIRLFPLGIGSGVSHSLIEGLARAGDGFAQAVQDGERMDNKVVRMLKAALSPHINDYTLEIEYAKNEDDEFEVIDRVEAGIRDACLDKKDATMVDVSVAKLQTPQAPNAPISLFDQSADPDKPEHPDHMDNPLPKLAIPPALQTPAIIPSLFPFSRTTTYVLLSPSTVQRSPEAVILRGTSPQGPLELRIPITILERPGTMIHSLAARKAAEELEEGRGWLTHVKTRRRQTLEAAYPSIYPEIVEREAVRLGETYQVANRWCSFVAVTGNSPEEAQRKQQELLAKAEKGEEEARAEVAEQVHGDKVMDTMDEDDSDGAKDSGVFESGYLASPNALPFIGYAFKRAAAPGGTHSPTQSMMASPRSHGYGQYAAQSISPPTRKGFTSPVTSRRISASSAAPPSPVILTSTSSASSFDRMVDSSSKDSAMPELGQTARRSPVFHTRGGRGGAVFGSFGSPIRARRAASPSAGEATYGAAPPKQDEDGNTVTALIDLQDFEGRWTASQQLAKLLGVEKQVLDQAGDKGCTAMVVVFLEEKMKAEQEVWEMIVDKARDWMKENSVGIEAEGEARAALGLAK